MTTDNKDTVKHLNKLIETCKDGEYGFRSCAENTKSESLRSTFSKRAGECEEGARELQQLVEQCGGEPDTGGSASGAMHRGWVSVKGTLSGHSDQAMLDECERGEDSAMEAYRECLKEDLPPQVKTVVERQYQGVKRNHDQIRDLRNRMKAAS
ncbi:PA2169 family four-helix-bundle protein [Methylibium sp.]|uniref:PA2169 family four-helix-bundle protein n=1 Tax=Methylibium sp. TaxID=2067992 RepID=UPI0017E554E1|nr:PA2169 family four-helix-bundle protein [Methylibium sp.]MBA3589706.1 PA2169 family four-helix-bundle protein [Methylibium sp.]